MPIILKLVERICSEGYGYRRVVVVRHSKNSEATRERTPQYSVPPSLYRPSISLRACHRVALRGRDAGGAISSSSSVP
jgi:hypothetical protein